MFCVLWQGQLRNKVEQEVVDVCLGLQHLHGSIPAVQSPDHRCSGSLTNILQESFTGKHTLKWVIGSNLTELLTTIGGLWNFWYEFVTKKGMRNKRPVYYI